MKLDVCVRKAPRMESFVSSLALRFHLVLARGDLTVPIVLKQRDREREREVKHNETDVKE